ncbi:enoyl-CoA hydratase [Methanophagales archaeon]|nr:enoyl-CoA hydratase [Methanophagales archaeon]
MTEGKRHIVYEKKQRVATVILNRPKSLNALNTDLLTELLDSLQDAETDSKVQAIVITGAGDKAFCAGADIEELLEKSPLEASEWSQWVQGILTHLEKQKKPVIAKINGFCLGGGLELAMACDFRIATEKAIFGQPEINLAIIPGGGGTQRLTRLIGKTKAMEMLMTGDHIAAEEAFRLSLVNRIVPADELDAAVDVFIKRLLTKSTVTLAIIKDAVNRGIEMDLEHALQYEAKCFGDALATEDARKGLKAFLVKQKSPKV